MKEVVNRNSYLKYLGKVFFILIVAVFVLLIKKPSEYIYILLFFIILSIAFLTQKFTESISFDSTKVSVVYVQFFLKKTIIIPINIAQLKIQSQSSFRSSKYVKLLIFRDGKKVYSIDGRDGFDDGELEQIAASFNELFTTK